MKPEEKAHALTVYIPDTRGVTVSRFGRGNAKIGTGPGIYTYSRLPGLPNAPALGSEATENKSLRSSGGTCPGATAECLSICYAARPVAEGGTVSQMWWRNSQTENLPFELPPDARIVRIHVSGDFTSPEYIRNWQRLVASNPLVRFFGYTRSWRVPELLPWLEGLRQMKNVQLFASMDKSTEERPPFAWRAAWIAGDDRLLTNDPMHERTHRVLNLIDDMVPRGMSFTCPEQTGHKADCESCRYCIDGQRGDVTFLKH